MIEKDKPNATLEELLNMASEGGGREAKLVGEFVQDMVDEANPGAPDESNLRISMEEMIRWCTLFAAASGLDAIRRALMSLIAMDVADLRESELDRMIEKRRNLISREVEP